MEIKGQRVVFHLSPEGRDALKGIVPRKGSFTALVVDSDTFGPVVRMRKTGGKTVNEELPLMFLRWDYIAAMACEYRFAPAPEGRRIGFTRE